MHRLHRLACALVAACCGATHLAGQSPPARVAVRGVAYDDLRREPFRDAVITLVGGSRSTTTDARGRFQFDSVAPGVQTFTMQHATLDSVGLSGLRARATITNGRDEVRIALPSFSALWGAACAGRPVPRDSGFVYGTIRDAIGMKAVANASVDMVWTELVMNEQRKIVQRRWRTQAVSDSTGSYTVCGVAPDHWLRIQASSDSTASDWIDLAPNAFRVRRRDLLIGPSAPADSARQGAIAGTVTDIAGNTVANARVAVSGATETRSDTNGRFVLQHVPTGTRQLDVSFIGAMPVVTIVDVMVRDTTTVAVRLGTPTRLEPVRVIDRNTTTGRVLAAAFDTRRKSGAGYSMDSTTIIKYNAFANALQSVPSVQTQYRRTNLTITMPNGRGGQCVPQVFIDGLEAGINHLIDLQPKEVAGLEVYPHAMSAPSQFLRAGTNVPPCGMILVWTKYGFQQR